MNNTIFSRSSHPSYIVTHYMKWVTTSWAYSRYRSVRGIEPLGYLPTCRYSTTCSSQVHSPCSEHWAAVILTFLQRLYSTVGNILYITVWAVSLAITMEVMPRCPTQNHFNIFSFKFLDLSYYQTTSFVTKHIGGK